MIVRSVKYHFKRFFSVLSLLSLGVLIFTTLANGQIKIISPKVNSISALNRQAVTVEASPGDIIQLMLNGFPIAIDTVRIDGKLDFLNNDVPPGDIVFTANLLDKNKLIRASAEISMHILGPPETIKIELEKEKLFADGISASKGVIKVFDRWNYQIQDGIILTVSADSGQITSDDIDIYKSGVQIPLKEGIASFEYVSGSNSGGARIKVNIGELQSFSEIGLHTPVEKFSIVGIASGTAQSSQASGDRSLLASKNDYPDGLSADGRVALYARGTVFEDYRLITSLDTDRKERARFYRELDPDFLYSIYGDNSMLFYDAQTTHPLYARIERNKSYLMLGDFNTELTKQEFTLYNRTLYGVKAVHESKTWNITSFGSLTDRKVVQRELRGTGLSGMYDVGNINITVGSEKVRIETRDRFQSQVLLKQSDLYRFSDYEIDYAQGTIFFKQPVPAIDAFGNPVYIVISFEAYDNRDKSILAGGRFEHQITDGLTMGVSGVVEEQQPSNYSLVGGDVKYTVGEKFSVSSELGLSNHFTGVGRAYKIESDIKPISELTLRGYYRNVEKDFINITQSGSGRELGTKKYGVSGNTQLSSTTKLSGDYYNSLQETIKGDVEINSLSGSIEQTFAEGFSSLVKLEDFRYDGPARDTSNNNFTTHSLLGTGRINYRAADRLTLAVQYERNLGENVDITRPNSTSLFAEYKLLEQVSLQAQQKFYEDGGSLSSFGVNSSPLEGTSLYGKYEIGNAIGQHRNMLSIGLKNKLKLTSDLAANFGFEKAKSLENRLGETPTDDHTAISGSLEYLPEKPIKATVKSEYGVDKFSKKSNYFIGLDFKVHPDLSMIGKYRLLFDNAIHNNGYQNRYHLIIGSAYRPIKTNWLNIIGKIELKGDNNHYIAPFLDDRASIASVHSYIEPIKRVELGIKLAYKLGWQRSNDFEQNTHTEFYLVNAKYYFTQSLDVGGEFRLMKQAEVKDLTLGYHAELGYVVLNNLRISAGYNFKGYKEKDLVEYSLWSKGPFVRMSFKFDESLFGL